MGNLRRFERKFHNASLRSSFEVFPEAHPRGIMINVLEKRKNNDDLTSTDGHASVHGGSVSAASRCLSPKLVDILVVARK